VYCTLPTSMNTAERTSGTIQYTSYTGIGLRKIDISLFSYPIQFKYRSAEATLFQSLHQTMEITHSFSIQTPFLFVTKRVGVIICREINWHIHCGADADMMMLENIVQTLFLSLSHRATLSNRCE